MRIKRSKKSIIPAKMFSQITKLSEIVLWYPVIKENLYVDIGTQRVNY